VPLEPLDDDGGGAKVPLDPLDPEELLVPSKPERGLDDPH
jgi:hypothetical protein